MQQASSTLFQLQTERTTCKGVNWHETGLFTWLTCVTVSILVQQVTSTWIHPQTLGTSCNNVHSHATSLFQYVSAPNSGNYTKPCPFACNNLVPLQFCSEQCKPRVTVSICVQQVTSTWFHPQTLGTSCNKVHSHATSLLRYVSAPNSAIYTKHVHSCATSYFHLVSSPNIRNLM